MEVAGPLCETKSTIPMWDNRYGLGWSGNMYRLVKHARVTPDVLARIIADYAIVTDTELFAAMDALHGTCHTYKTRRRTCDFLLQKTKADVWTLMIEVWERYRVIPDVAVYSRGRYRVAPHCIDRHRKILVETDRFTSLALAEWLIWNRCILGLYTGQPKVWRIHSSLRAHMHKLLAMAIH